MARIESSPIPTSAINRPSVPMRPDVGQLFGSGEIVVPRDILTRSENSLRIEDVPLSFIPVERGNLGNRLETGCHELNHALVARSLGVKVVSLSVKREGNSLGRTTFAGIISPGDFKIIAAAGAVRTPIGTASGYGNDIFKVRIVNFIQKRGFDAPIKPSISEAASKLSWYSEDVIKNAAEIIAFRGQISGSLLDEVLARAELEVELGKAGRLHELIEVLGPPKKDQQKAYPLFLPEKPTHIKYLEGGNYLLTQVDGDSITEFHICGRCGGVDTHNPWCQRLEKRDEQLIVSLPLPRKDLIYSHSTSSSRS